MNLRCSIIGFENNNNKSLLEWFLNQPYNSEVNGFKNHFWNGITTFAFAKICRGIIENNFWFNGLQHIVPADIINKADMLSIFSKVFNRQDIKIRGINTNIGIDRSIETLNKIRNKKLWEMAGYDKIPTINDLIEEIKEFDYHETNDNLLK
jgi:dTDP-4-dehydrorhamnose reductase